MPEEKAGDRKFSQEEAKLISLSKRFLRQISVATKNFRMYSDSHPFLKNSVNNAGELLKSILLMKENATFTFMETSCLIEDIPLKNLDLKTYSFLTTAKECGITSLTFIAGLTDEELQAVLKIISGGPNVIRKEGGLADFVQRSNLSHIKADEIFFKKVSKKEEESREAKKHLEDFLIINYLMGKTAMSKDDIASMVGEVTVDPKRMGKILSDVALSGKGGGGPEGGSSGSGRGTGSGAGGTSGSGEGSGGGSGSGSSESDDDSSGIEFAKAGIEKLAINIKNVQGKPYEEVKQNIGSLIMALEPSVRSKVVNSKIPVSGTSDDLVGDILREVSDDVVMELITSDIVGNKLSVVRMKKLIERLLPDKAKRDRLFPILEERLIKGGVAQDICSRVLEEKFWSEMSIDEMALKVTSEKPAFCIEMGISDMIYKLAEDLLTNKKFDSLKSVIDKALENLKSKDAGLKARFLRDFKKIYMMLLQSKDYPHKEELVNIIRIECKDEKDPAVVDRCLNILSDSVTACIKNKWYAHLPPLLNTVGYEKVKTGIIKDIKLEDLFRDMLKDKSLNRRYIEDVAKEMGRDATSALRNMVMSIVSDDFDSYMERFNITLILKGLGEDTEDIFIKELVSDRTGTLKNALEALSEIGTKRCIGDIEKLLQHTNPEIRNRAGMALKRINKRS